MVDCFIDVMQIIATVSATLIMMIFAVTTILYSKNNQTNSGFFEIKLILKYDLVRALLLIVLLPIVIIIAFSNYHINETIQVILLICIPVLLIYVMTCLIIKMYYITLQNDCFEFEHNSNDQKPKNLYELSLERTDFNAHIFKKRLYPKVYKIGKNKNKKSNKEKNLFEDLFEIGIDEIFMNCENKFELKNHFNEYQNNKLKFQFDLLKPHVQAPDQVIMICLDWLYPIDDKQIDDKQIKKSILLLNEYICYILLKKKSVSKIIFRFDYYCITNSEIYSLYADLLCILSNMTNDPKLLDLAKLGYESSYHIDSRNHRSKKIYQELLRNSNGKC